MIFATVGSQMPFDRLIQGLDDWSRDKKNTVNVFAQIGNSKLNPLHMDTVSSLSPSAFREAVGKAKIIVAHAGMGSVLTALELGRPLVVVPRLGALLETRNDHQVATAKWLSTKSGIFVAMEISDLAGAIDRAYANTNTKTKITSFATPELIKALHAFIHS